MYAIVDIAGMQFKIGKGDRIKVPKLGLAIGEETQLTNVLLWSKEDGVSIGQPVLSDVAVNAKVLGHSRGKKVTVFKMKRRKGYRKKTGHRQDVTELLIEDFVRPGEINEAKEDVLPEEITVSEPTELPIIEEPEIAEEVEAEVLVVEAEESPEAQEAEAEHTEDEGSEESKIEA